MPVSKDWLLAQAATFLLRRYRVLVTRPDMDRLCFRLLAQVGTGLAGAQGPAATRLAGRSEDDISSRRDVRMVAVLYQPFRKTASSGGSIPAPDPP